MSPDEHWKSDQRRGRRTDVKPERGRRRTDADSVRVRQLVGAHAASLHVTTPSSSLAWPLPVPCWSRVHDPVTESCHPAGGSPGRILPETVRYF